MRARVMPGVGWLQRIMVGNEINVEYSEGGESLSQLLPRSGVIVREVVLEDWDAGWYLLRLNEPFDYQHNIAEPYVFREMRIGHSLIKSRWKGLQIGAAPTSVFLLFVPDVAILDTAKVSSKDFIYAGWGMVH
jgi:hypothetical protein